MISNIVKSNLTSFMFFLLVFLIDFFFFFWGGVVLWKGSNNFEISLIKQV